jgi:hypothetical protein
MIIRDVAICSTPPGNPPSQAGHCSGNRQITVNAILTIVINLTFTPQRPPCGHEAVVIALLLTFRGKGADGLIGD